MIYTIDTNVVIRYLRKDSKVLANFRAAVSGGHTLLVPKIVDYEVTRGFERFAAPKKQAIYLELIENDILTVEEMNDDYWNRACKVYSELCQKGFTVGELDILIAAFCLENGGTLVTNNLKDFENIDGLNIIDWTK